MQVQIIKCFISSPGDTDKERGICDDVFSEINNSLGEELGFRIESIRWEKDVLPSFGVDGQAVINDQVGNDYQIFVGILWNRFGTPTPRAGSGTEEEFLLAYERVLKKEDLEIFFYFNTKAENSNRLDLEQVQKVRSFKSSVAERGGFYNEFEGPEEFRRNLRKHVERFVIKKFSAAHDQPKATSISEDIETAVEPVQVILKQRFDDALSLFSGQPLIWVEPNISNSNVIGDLAEKDRVTLLDILTGSASLVIKAPPQFGQTCLAHNLIYRARSEIGKSWIYLDAMNLNAKDIEKAVNRERNIGGQFDLELDCIVLDSWSSSAPGSKKLLKNLAHNYKEVRIIVMQVIDEINFAKEEPNENIGRPFDVLHLLALERKGVRSIVEPYNLALSICEDNTLLDKLTKDLEVLNIHRTPLNCLTLLKVSEIQFDESPANRTKMIEMVLFVLFDLDHQRPSYATKPDLKDCEYVLGEFCEKLIRENRYEFSVDQFTSKTLEFCTRALIELDTRVVFDVLFNNNILISRNGLFSFRATYWIYYFAARRMMMNDSFYSYIVIERGCATFPEIIDFYTGIDRNRGDTLKVLLDQVRQSADEVEIKTGFQNSSNPFSTCSWNPSQVELDHMSDYIQEEVIASNLPESLKDTYADKSYNKLRPYDQSVYQILDEYSMLVLMRRIKASSRALRNSDYVDVNLKRELMSELMRGWELVSKLLIALSPVLANKGEASFEGSSFVLDGDFGATPEERIRRIILVSPTNVIKIFRDDLFSQKMGPLLFDAFERETNDLSKHHLALLLIHERPSGWKKYIDKYIVSIDKNSFYLFDTVECINAQLNFSFHENDDRGYLTYLLKKGFAKHDIGVSNPTLNEIKKVTLSKQAN